MFGDEEHDGLDGDDAIESGEPVEVELVDSAESGELSLDTDVLGAENFVVLLDRNESTEEVFQKVDEVIGWLKQDLQSRKLATNFGDEDSVNEGLRLIDDNFVNVCRVVFYEIKKKREELGFEDEDDQLLQDDYVHTIYNLHDTLYLLRDQIRDSGESYFYSHIIGVLLILIKVFGFTGSVTRTSAIVHDTSEDLGVSLFKLVNAGEYAHRLTSITDEEINEFNRRVTNIVTGLTKLKSAASGISDTREAKAVVREATLRMFLTMFLREAKICPVKLADRLHNMRTLNTKEGSESKKRIVDETEEVYAPFAKIARLRDGYRELVLSILQNKSSEFVVDFNQLQVERSALLEGCFSEIEATLEDCDHVEGSMFRNISIAEYVDGVEKPQSDVRIPDLEMNCLDSMQECVVYVKEGQGDVLKLVGSYIIGMFEMEPVESVNIGEGKSLVGFSRLFQKQLSFRIITRVNYNREIRGVYVGDEDALDPFKDQIRSLVDRRKAGSIDNIIDSARAELLKKPIRLNTPLGDEYEFPAGSSYFDFLAAVNPYEMVRADFAEWSSSLKSKTATRFSMWDELKRSSDPRNVPMVNIRTLGSEEIKSPEDLPVSPLWLLYCMTPKARTIVKRILSDPLRYYNERVLGIEVGHHSNEVFDYLGEESGRSYVLKNGEKCVNELASLFNISYKRVMVVLKNGTPDEVDENILYDLGSGEINPLYNLVKSIKPRVRWNISLNLVNQPGVMEKFSREFGRFGFSLGGIKSKRKGEVDLTKMFVSKPHGSADMMIDTYEFFKVLIRMRLSYPDLKVTDSIPWIGL